MLVLYEDTGKILEYHQLHNHTKYAQSWNKSFSKKMGRLCQGVGKGLDGQGQRIKVTDKIFITDYEKIPRDHRKEINYTSIVCKVRPHKEDSNFTHIIIGGNHICYPGDMGTPKAYLELFKLIINIVISRQGDHFATFNINCLPQNPPKPA